jgi:translation initiation factor IF-3
LGVGFVPAPYWFFSRRCPFDLEPAIATPAANEPPINDRIRAREVRVIDQDGQQLGIKPLPEALALSREAELDLVLIAPQAVPPVAKIMDYGKWRYEEAQKAKESRKKSTNISIKEMKYRPKIGTGDFDTKTRLVQRFLTEGHKVKVTIMFRGREMAHPELGMKILDHVAAEVADVSKVEASPKIDGRNMVMVLAPEKKKPVKPPREPAAAPLADGPTVEASTAEAPVAQTPVVEAPAAEAPVAEAQAAEAATPQPTPTSPPAASEAPAAN